MNTLTPEGMAELNAAINGNPTITTALTGDDLLTALAQIAPENRFYALSVCGVRILREAADLCGIDSTDMGKRAAIKAIVSNF